MQGLLQRLINRSIAAIYIAFVFLTSTFFFLGALIIRVLTGPFDKRLRLLHRYTCVWANLYLWIFPPWAVSVHGRSNIDKAETYVIVSNHLSLVDILAVFRLFTHFKWVSKAELFNIPLIGWNMSLNRYVKLRRGNPKSIERMYRACERHLREGSSVFLFPEGTRSETGDMRPFKEGAFVLAKRMGRPILPVVINGSRHALPKNSLNFHGHTRITLTVLPPIYPDTFRETPVRELAAEVREVIKAQVKPD